MKFLEDLINNVAWKMLNLSIVIPRKRESRRITGFLVKPGMTYRGIFYLKDMKRDFLTLRDLSSEEIGLLLKRAIELKSGKDANKCPLIGKSIGLLFEKASTRTRVSLEVGIYQLGAQAIYMNPKEIQIGRGETIHDTAKVLSTISKCGCHQDIQP